MPLCFFSKMFSRSLLGSRGAIVSLSHHWRCLEKFSKINFLNISSSSGSSSSSVQQRSLPAESMPPAAAADEGVLEPEAYDVAERREWVLKNIENAIGEPTNQLFAVIHIQNKQFKVIQDDLIHIEHNIPLDVGEEINLEKVLMVGGADFTLVGRPLLDPRFVHIRATVVEKTTTSPEVQYNFRIQTKTNPIWLSHELTVLRINQISVEKGAMGEH